VLQLPLHHQFKNIFLHKLKHEKELVVVFDDFVEPDDVGMVEFLEHFDLVEVDAFLPVGILLLDLFDGYDLFGLFVDGLDDGAETAIAEGFA
jgi:hypothetical protein